MSIPETLKAAATKLREMAKGTSRGHWYTGDCEIYPRWILSAGEADQHGYAADVIRISEDFADELSVSDANWAWMAFAHPGLAEPLAIWLDWAAKQWAARDDVAKSLGLPVRSRADLDPAVAVARVILGEVAE